MIYVLGLPTLTNDVIMSTQYVDRPAKVFPVTERITNPTGRYHPILAHTKIIFYTHPRVCPRRMASQ